MLKIFICLSLFIYIPQAFAQAEITATESNLVKTKESISDEVIQTRIEKIISATQWFPNLKIETKEGLVFLKGQVESQKQIDWLKKLLQKTEGVIAVVDNELEVTQITNVLSPVQNELDQFFNSSQKKLPYYIAAILCFLLFLVFALLGKKISQSFLQARKVNSILIGAINTGILIIVLILGLFLALKIAGLSGLAYTLLGGTGAISIGLGLALKNTIENYISGLIISVKGIFLRGEVVEINGFQGVVQAVSARGTSLMDFEGNSIVIPNSQVFQSAITNFTRNPKMRAEFSVGIAYECSIEKARQVILSEFESLKDKIINDPKPLVLVDELGAATVNLKVYFWFNAIEYTKQSIRSFIIQHVKEALIRENISLPDDAREIVFANPLQLENITSKKSSLLKKITPQVEKAQDQNLAAPQNLESDLQKIQQQALQAPLVENDGNYLK